jgi:hypothetical protein
VSDKAALALDPMTAVFGCVATKVSPAPAIKPRKTGEILPIIASVVRRLLHHSLF